MTVLSEIKQHLVNKSIVTTAECKYNCADTSNEQVVLWQYGGYGTDFGQQPTIQIKVFSATSTTAETKINAIYDELIANDTNKYKMINTTKMWINANQQPFFSEKDTQGRVIWIFNITVITKR